MSDLQPPQSTPPLHTSPSEPSATPPVRSTEAVEPRPDGPPCERASGLRVEVIALGASEEGWWAELAVHAEVEDRGVLEVALYLEAERVRVGYLDEWGDWQVRLEGLRPPQRRGLISFEAIARPVRLRAETQMFEAPLTHSAVRDAVERERSWPKERSLRGAQLQGATLSQANLSGVDLREVNLQGAKLWGANLKGALLQRAQLQEANLLDADLSFADLEGANLSGARLERATLEGADLSNAQLEGVSFEGAQLKGARLEETQLKAVNFREASLKDVDLTRSNLEGAQLPGAHFESVRIRGVNLSRAELTGASFAHADLTNALLEGADPSNQVAANQVTAPAQATKATANQELEKQKIAFAGTQSAAIAQLASSIETLPTAITMFEELGAELGITAATAAIAEVLRAHHALVSSPADPNDRFGMFEFATQLRKDRVRWEEITERVNEAGYRNRSGGLWKMLSLRRALDRECERRGISLKAMGRRR